MILWHLLAILLTVILVTSGFDWLYYNATRSPLLADLMFPSHFVGGTLPLMLPLILMSFPASSAATAG